MAPSLWILILCSIVTKIDALKVGEVEVIDVRIVILVTFLYLILAASSPTVLSLHHFS